MPKPESEGRHIFRITAEKPVLTLCEKKVLTLAAMGYTRKEVAGRLDKAEHTVQNQMSDLQERLGVRTVLQASLKGVARGIINPGEICRARGIEDPASVITQLSDREIQLLETMSLDGGAKSSLKEVGKQLGISVHTVRNHLTRIYNTTGVRDEVFAVMLYLAAKEQPIIPAHPKGV